MSALTTREDALRCTTVAERISFIVQLMGSGRWFGATTKMQLCRVWGLSKPRVEQYYESAAYSFRIEISDGERNERKRTALALLDRIKHEAFSPGTRDMRIALDAIKLEAALCGFFAKEAYKVKTGAEEFEAWSTEELESYAETGTIPLSVQQRESGSVLTVQGESLPDGQQSDASEVTSAPSSRE